MTVDPKRAAQERFASCDWNQRGMSAVERCATDPPLVVRGLLDAVGERAAAGARVAELGFGPGWLLQELRDQLPGRALYGLDLSPGMARNAYERFRDAVRVVTGDMERLPFREASFDVIVTCWTLYFMNDIDRALAETVRCLRPSGRLIAATSAPDHEAECGEIVAEAIRVALGREDAEHDVGRRFDLETGAAYVERHFPRAHVRAWPGEMVLSDPDDVAELWPKWEPALFAKEEQLAVRKEFMRLALARLDRDGELRIRRRNGAFVCDLS